MAGLKYWSTDVYADTRPSPVLSKGADPVIHSTPSCSLCQSSTDRLSVECPYSNYSSRLRRRSPSEAFTCIKMPKMLRWGIERLSVCFMRQGDHFGVGSYRRKIAIFSKKFQKVESPRHGCRSYVVAAQASMTRRQRAAQSYAVSLSCAPPARVVVTDDVV
jgi:hypothetical protein